MPGFMGLGNQHAKNIRNAELKRRETLREPRNVPNTELAEIEKRSEEKVDEILMDQTETADIADEGKPVVDERGTRLREAAKKAMSLKAGDIMSARIATVTFDDTVMVVKGIFSKVRFHHLPVIDDTGGLIGIISDRDFLKSISPFLGTINEQTRDVELMKKKVGLIMTRNPVSVTVETDMVEAIKLMNERKVSCLPVVAPGTKHLMGIVTWKDIVRAFCPEAFPYSRVSGRLKTGVHIKPRTTESGRFMADEYF